MLLASAKDLSGDNTHLLYASSTPITASGIVSGVILIALGLIVAFFGRKFIKWFMLYTGFVFMCKYNFNKLDIYMYNNN
ncbi:hypothetical protein AYI69_g7756 [Smittium culicis]|uniref:Uncharacterized protein n=1 Tax=Smittium culicis TaxID=133412 RepID=A0A1R1XPS9_9FUNG|nr:hypothetical protein AYI69_g7756 [Smittium culicis]